MRTTRLLWCLVICLFPAITNAQLYTYKDVNQLLKKAEQDSIAQIERMAALEFHKLINQYRKENGLNTIEWNETLWIATQNHNLWMANTGKLSHHQTTNNKYYSGTSPGERLRYAQGDNTNFGWSGENALYNYSNFGNTKEEIAQNIAKKSFIQWKNSKGHNENMLSKRHGSHGVAFKINGSVVWGTDLFSSYGGDHSNNQTFYAKHHSATPQKVSTKKSKRFSTAKNRRLVNYEVISTLSDELNLKQRNWNSKKGEARRLAYRIANKKYKTYQEDGIIYTETQESVKKSFLGLFNKTIHTYSAIIEKNVDDFDSEAVSKQLAMLLKEKQPFNTKSKIDFAVVLKKRKNLVRVTLVSVLQNPTGKINVF